MIIDAVVETEGDAGSSHRRQALAVDAQQENLGVLRKALHAHRLIQEGQFTQAQVAGSRAARAPMSIPGKRWKRPA